MPGAAADIIRIWQSNSAQPDNFYRNIRSMSVATFTLLCLWILLLLFKYILNVLFGGKRGAGLGGESSYQQWRKRGSAKKGGYWARMTSGTVGSMPPPPPAAAPNVQGPGGMPLAAGGMGAAGPGAGPGVAGAGGPGMGGAGAGMVGPGEDWGSQGVNSEKGSPYDPPSSEALSRAGDVARLGFLFLLGGTVLNALSFDPSAGANALTWVAFALFSLWALLTLLMRSRWVPLIMGFITFPIVLAIYSLAFIVSSNEES